LITESFEFEGIPINCYRAGGGPALLLLHGSGPGASSVGNWQPVLPALAERFDIYAMDLIGFGKSGRKPAPPYFDYSMWVRQATAMLNRIPQKRVGVIAHSLSASVGLTMAAAHSRVAGVMTTGAMGAPFPLQPGTIRTWTCPQNRQQLVEALSGLIHDTSRIDEAYLQAREQVILAPGYADYFDEMFEGDRQKYIDAAILPDDTLARVQCPVLMLHGREDGAFPPSSSQQIASKLKRVDFMLLSDCSHSVAAERTGTFLALANEFFDELLNNK
jgi:2-hydroxymuconate-semialdehyde hydrolase